MKQNWTIEELEEFWTLHPEEYNLLQNKSGETRLSFVFMLKYFQLFSHFPNEQDIISSLVLSHLAKQVDIADTIFKRSNLTSSTAKVHKRQIRVFLGFRPSKKSDITPFINCLIEKVLPEGKDSIPFLRERSYMYFRQLKIEPFSSQYIDRYINSALTTFENSLFQRGSDSLTNKNKKALIDLLEPQENQSPEVYYLRHLKQDAGNVSLESILEEVKKINCIQQIELPKPLFNGISHRILEKYKSRIMSERPSEIRDHPDSTKYATLSMFCYVRNQEIIDNLIDLLIQVIHKIGKKSEDKVNKKIITELKKVDGKKSILLNLAKVTVANPDGIIKDVVSPVVKPETLQEIIKESELTKSYKEQVYTFMRASYSSHYRRMLAPILETISFESNNALHQPVLKALKVLKKYLDSAYIYYPAKQHVPIKGIIKPGWQDIIVEKLKKKR